jgi:hypothetical protein
MSSRNDKPLALRRHKATNRARLRVRGRDIYGPDWGRGKRPTKECKEWYLDLIARWGAGWRCLAGSGTSYRRLGRSLSIGFRT